MLWYRASHLLGMFINQYSLWSLFHWKIDILDRVEENWRKAHSSFAFHFFLLATTTINL